MHPVHDIDSLLLLATLLSAKRRPAELVEIVAAVDLIQGNIPNEAKLAEAFTRLAQHGLLCAAAGGYALTPAAQEIVDRLPKKGEAAERLFAIKDRLAAYNVKGEHAAILLSAEQLTAAILAHRAGEKLAGKNLLMPKPKPEVETKRPGQRQRKPLPAKKRKD